MEAHQEAFHYFGGVFRRLRYDNLGRAVKKILRGHRREETARFIAFGSHGQFEASFCTPAQGHENGGVEGEVGYFRRHHLVPVPQVSTWEELNAQLLRACQADLHRVLGERTLTVGQALEQECPHRLALQLEDFELAEEHFCRVDGKGCVQVRTNWDSTPLRPGTQVRVRVLPATVTVEYAGQVVASHVRCYRRRQQSLDLEHYLDVLERTPGALAGSTPLAQGRAAGRWTGHYDQLWAGLMERHGRQEGTRRMSEVLQWGRTAGYESLARAIEQTLASGAQAAAAVRYGLNAPAVAVPAVAP